MRPSKAKIARRNNLKKARAAQMKTPKMAAIEFVFGCFVAGLTYQSIKNFWSAFQRPEKIISESNFYDAQNFSIPIIIKSVMKNCKIYQQKMKNGATISIDGSWDHRRNGKFCIVEAIDIEQKKVVAFSIVDRPTQKNPDAKFKSAANQMEIEGVRQIIEQLKPLKKVVAYVHDKDAKTTKLIEKEWGIKEYIDPNHSNKSFNKKFTKYNAGKSTKCTKGSLAGLHHHISKFKALLTFSDYSNLKKEQLWMNVLEHFKNNHTLCLHPPYSDKSEENKHIGKWGKNLTKIKEMGLYNFLSATLSFVTKVNSNITTQSNEAFHSLKAQLASKNTAWGKSYAARMCVAILRFNEPRDHWKILREALGIVQFIGGIATACDGIFRMRQRKRVYNKKRRLLNNKMKKEVRAKVFKDDHDPGAGYRLN